MTDKCKVAVLISGSGTNLQSLIDAARAEDFPATVALVISNKADAGGVARAEGAGIPVKVISHQQYDSREAFDRAMSNELEAAGIEMVCLAGFMRILSEWFVKRWQGRLINIHPSLLPAFKGESAVKDALDYGVKITGCTVHLVTPEIDSGPILVQAAVPVAVGDTVDELHSRIRAQEHQIYPATVKWLAQQLLQSRS